MNFFEVEAIFKKISSPKLSKFFKSLIPTDENILGVSLKELKKIAKELKKNDFSDFFENAPENIMEMIILKGYLIGYAKIDFESRLNYIERFLPKIKNWAVCDTFCASLKIPDNKKQEFWKYIIYCTNSKKEFYVRFAIVMMFKYINSEYLEKILEILDNIHFEKRYVEMAQAWLIAEICVKYPERIFTYLKSDNLSKFAHNMAIRKILDSFRVNDNLKTELKLLTYKKNSNKI